MKYADMKYAHGTESGYTRGGCRCDECKAARAVSNARWRARRRGEYIPEIVVNHGTLTAFLDNKCRCASCVAMAEGRARKIRFTDAELAAEHYAALVDIDVERQYFHRDSVELKERFVTITRFATSPSYDAVQ